MRLIDQKGKTTVMKQEVELHILGEVINTYLRTVPEEAGDAFIGRYYFHDSLEEIAGYCRISVSKVKNMLYRLRKGLKAYLDEEGFFMDKQDISDAMAFLDEDMIRHTELLCKKHARDKRENGKRRERLRFDIASAACVLLLGILVALMVFTLNRGGITGLKEQGEDMTVQGNKESGTEDMSALHSEENTAEDSGD